MAELATILPFGFSSDPSDFLDGVMHLGCRRCQYYRNTDNPPNPADARKLVEEAGARFDSIHGVFGEDIDPSSPDPAERTRCVEIFTSEGQLARELGGPMIVVHPSRFNKDRATQPPDEARAAQDERWSHLDDFLERLEVVGRSLDVVYLIENQPYNCPLGHDPVQLAQHVLAIDSPHIRMCFDTGHANLTSDVVQTLRQCRDAIDYLHIHDNDGTKDDHQVPGDGTIDWRAFAEVVAHLPHATRMLEVFRDGSTFRALAAGGLADQLRADLALS